MTYVVAVSGGVDSVVMLHKMTSHDNPNVKIVVAHFDHGMRVNSPDDAEFVRQLARKNSLEFELGEGNLGIDASEEAARNARYRFLESVQEKYKAEKIVTAHHQDDLLETMVLNMIRGTSPRGLAPMQNTNIIRPLINLTKQDIMDYANDNQLAWREDPSNTDDSYLRNYIRMNITPSLSKAREELLDINKSIAESYQEIDVRVRTLAPTNNILRRTNFVVLPVNVQREVIRAWLLRTGLQDLDYALIERLAIATCTQTVGSKVDINAKLWLSCEKQNVLIVAK